MPVRKSTPKTSVPMSAEAPQKRTVTFTLPSKLPMPKSWTPILMGLLLVASFLLGALFTKVQYMSNGTTAPSAGTQTAGAQPSTAPTGPVNVANGNLPALGNKGAKVTVIEFADYQ